MEEAFRNRDFDRFILLESQYYTQNVKAVENPEWHEDVYAKIQDLVESYGDFIRPRQQRRSGVRELKLVYLLPALTNDLAHIQFLYNIFKHHPSGESPEIYIAAYHTGRPEVGSKLMAKLQAEGRIRIVLIPLAHHGLQSFADFFEESGFSHLVVYSIPMMLPAWVRALGARRVAWATTKFELSCFPNLVNRISFCGSKIERVNVRGKEWVRSVAAIPRDDVIIFMAEGRSRTRLVSVNRPEKMLSQVFLEAVANILERAPQTTFFWTGRERDSRILRFFEARNLSARQEFIGWIDPGSELPKYDIFLDTYGLSGMVATSAYAAGMPVVAFRESKTWLEMQEERLRASELSEYERALVDRYLVSTPLEYSNAALSLIFDDVEYHRVSASQRSLAERFLIGDRVNYETHMEVLQSNLIFTREET